MTVSARLRVGLLVTQRGLGRGLWALLWVPRSCVPDSSSQAFVRLLEVGRRLPCQGSEP
jgi:hypothetical protein